MSTVAAAGVVPASELEAYRRELTGYCYRMLGSIYEAEDAVQETMLRAWRALPTFEDRAGVRPWLYRIATNVSLDVLKGRARRALPMDLVSPSSSEGRLGARRPEEAWVEPAPDGLVLPDDGDPAELVVARESVRLAFVAALQHLAPRQRAVLMLRDVLRWRASEVAELLDTSADAVNSALRRARAVMTDAALEPAREPSHRDRELLALYVDAFHRHDVDAFVRLLRDDAIVEMPPYDLWMIGRETIREWVIAVGALSDHTLVPVRANGSIAAAVYRPESHGGEPVAFAIHTLDVVEGRISAIHSFIDAGLFRTFGLPDRLQAEIGQA